MDQLKKLLRLAIAEQASCLVLISGREPELIGPGMPRLVTSEGKVEAAFVKRMYTFLFPSDLGALSAGEVTKGLLQVPNVGRIHLIAEPLPVAALRLYLPPSGANLFAAEWQKRSVRGASTPVVPPVPPTLNVGPPMPILPGGRPNPAAPPVPGSLQTTQPMPVTAPPPQPVVLAADPAAAVTQPPAGASDVFGAGFIPMNLGVAPANGAPAAAGVQTAPAMQTVQALHQAVTAPPAAVAPTLVMPPVTSGSSSSMRLNLDALDDDAGGGAANVFSGALAPQTGTAPAAHYQAPPVAAPALPVSISFAALQPGEAAISAGQNPVDSILADLVKRRGSDLHITCGEPLVFRIDGDIVRLSKKPTTPADVEGYLLPIMPKRNQTEFATINDTDFAYEIRGLGRFRVNVFRDKNGVGSVMRHIPSTILTAEQLQLPPAITRFCALTKGLVLVTGPTGSGKSTTLAAMIDLINKQRSDHILTVEDPIEFVHAQQKCLVNQREVHRHTGSFSRALKAALREDPDIVLIGEMRDLETVSIAIETAETGHLVFGTLHTNTAISTIDRIVDQFPTDRQEQIRMMLASSLRGVVAQTLLKKKGGGRVAAHEILVTNDAVSAMIREGKIHMLGNHMQSQKADGNILLNESLMKLAREGVVEVDEVLRKAIDRNGLAEMMKRAGMNTAPKT